MWEELEDVVRRMKRKIPGAHPPGLNRALDSAYQGTQYENSPHNPVDRILDSAYQEAQYKNIPQNPVCLGTVQ